MSIATKRPAHPHASRQSLLLATALLLVAAPTRAEVNLNFGGKVQSDLRFRTQTKSVGGWYQRLEAPVGVSRNENIFKFKLDASIGSFAGVAELDFVLLGYSHELDGIGGLALREEVDPYRIEAHALYLEAVDFLLDGLDLRIGQQLVFWGKGDQFNPTNTINSNDIEDPLLFGEQVANMMVRVDYTPGTRWTVSGVLVPIFKPALLPQTAPLGLSNSDRMPMIESSVRHRIISEKAFTSEALGYPTVVANATPVLPERSLENMQGALRVGGSIGEQDVALSYYVGRTDVPQPYLNVTTLQKGVQCDPLDGSQCINGLLRTEVFLGYPRMQVVGLNVAGQVNALGWISETIRPIGYRFELGLFFPQSAGLALIQQALDFGGALSRPAGEYPYGLGEPGQLVRPLVVDDTPFAKWVVGLDYTFTQYLYVNAQWVHGFPDEFGAGDFISEGWAVRAARVDNLATVLPCVLNGQDCQQHPTEILMPRLNDFLVLGVDIKLLGERLLTRLFTIWHLNGVVFERWDPQAGERVREHRSLFSADGFSAVIYPEINYNFGKGLELGAGALLMLGREHSKFGDPATGGTQVFTRARWLF